MSAFSKLMAFFGWIVAAVAILLRFKKTGVTVTPGKVDAPGGQDKTDLLTQEEIKKIIGEVQK